MATAANALVANNNTAQWILAQDSEAAAERFAGEYWISNVGTSNQSAQMNGAGLSGYTGKSSAFYGYLGNATHTYLGLIMSSASSNISGQISIYGLA